MALNKLIRDETGQVMILVLILLVVGVLIITPLLSYMGSGLKVGQVYEKNMDEFYAADSGIELGMWKLLNGETAAPPVYELNNADVAVTIIGPVTYNEAKWQTFGLSEDDTVYQITSTATTGSDSSTTIESYVTTTTGSLISDDPDDYDFYSSGNFETNPDDVIPGSVYSVGNVILQEGVTINGDVYTEGNVQLVGAGATINGNVYAVGNVQLEPYSTINGYAISEANIQLKEGAVIDGSVCAREDVQLENNATLTGNAYADVGNVQLNEGATIGGNVYIGSGSINLNGGVIIGEYPLPYDGCPLGGSSSMGLLTWELN